MATSDRKLSKGGTEWHRKERQKAIGRKFLAEVGWRGIKDDALQ